jgi:hypothetical protein
MGKLAIVGGLTLRSGRPTGSLRPNGRSAPLKNTSDPKSIRERTLSWIKWQNRLSNLFGGFRPRTQVQSEFWRRDNRPRNQDEFLFLVTALRKHAEPS